MRKINIYQVDSFTKQKLRGNPAGVVTNAELLNEQEMQAIARELNNSETAFILPPDAEDHEVKIRFFTPTIEVPSCGHATIAAHYVRAIENNYGSRIYNHKIGIGVLQIEIEKNQDDYKVFMNQGKPEFLSILDDVNLKELISALGLTKNDIDNRAPFQIVNTGHSKVMVPLKEKNTLNSLLPDFHRLAELSKLIKCNGYYVFTLVSHFSIEEELDKEVLVHGRMFAPVIGINEDPVTGNANGPLGAYIVKYNLIKNNSRRLIFKAMQGEAIKRPGIVDVIVDIKERLPVNVKIGGEAIIAFKTHITI